jgi:sec-independent protein translocase protein TatA
MQRFNYWANNFIVMGLIGLPEMLLILVVALFFFGPDKLPEIARSLGKATGEFKKAQIQTENEIQTLGKPMHEKDTNQIKSTSG